MPDRKILDIYRGLWRIEESFKITKSELKTRPVYVSTKEHIEAHFLICFVALLLLRLLEIQQGINILSKPNQRDEKYNRNLLDENYYMFDYFNEIVEDLGNVAGIDFSRGS